MDDRVEAWFKNKMENKRISASRIKYSAVLSSLS